MLKKLIFALILLDGLLAGFYVFQRKPDYACRDCNVIMINMTNLNFDHMSMNGYFRPTTPNLDKLAKDSLNFTNAFAHASWTLPESISIFTSLYPFEHGLMNRYDGSKLAKDTPTLVDILNKNGYKTAAFTGGSDYSSRYGLTDRFSTYEECTKKIDPEIYLPPFQYGEFGCTIPKALKWLKDSSSKKFFLFLQGYDAHCPFAKHAFGIYDKDYEGTVDFTSCVWTFDKTEPVVKNGKTYYPVYVSKEIRSDEDLVLIDETDKTHLIALYDEQVTATDRLLGEFLDEVKGMGLDQNTIIIFTSEHGDIFGKHGRFMRGGPLRGTFYDEVLHIPLFIKNPKIKPAKLNQLVQHIDIMPTLLDLLGINNIKIQGKSLTPLLYGKQVNDNVFAGSEFNPDPTNVFYTKKTRIESLRTNEWKLIAEFGLGTNPPSKSFELYDIQNDKEEAKNLADERKDILNNLQTKLNGWSEKIRQKAK